MRVRRLEFTERVIPISERRKDNGAFVGRNRAVLFQAPQFFQDSPGRGRVSARGIRKPERTEQMRQKGSILRIARLQRDLDALPMRAR